MRLSIIKIILFRRSQDICLEEYPMHTKPIVLIKITLLLTSLLIIIANATIAPTLPAIQATFADTPGVALLTRLVFTMPALFVVIGSLVAGTVIDKFGRKPLLIGSAILYALAGSSGFLLDNLFLILIGRALLGLALAGIMTSITTLIADYFEGEARTQFLGLQMAFNGASAFVLLIVSGFLADLNWRIPFLIHLTALGLIPLLMVALYEPKPIEKAKSSTVSAHVPVKLLTLIYSLTFITMTTFHMLPVQLSYYLESLIGASGLQIGIAFALSSIFSTLSAFFYGKVKRRLEYVQIMGLVLVTLGFGFGIIGFAGNYTMVLIGSIITGLALGLMMPNFAAWITDVAPPEIRGRAVGGSTMAIFLGQFLCPLWSQPIVDTFSYETTFIVVGAFVLGLAIFLFAVRYSLRQPMTVSQHQ